MSRCDLWWFFLATVPVSLGKYSGKQRESVIEDADMLQQLCPCIGTDTDTYDNAPSSPDSLYTLKTTFKNIQK